jgi:hypothetical protein
MATPQRVTKSVYAKARTVDWFRKDQLVSTVRL